MHDVDEKQKQPAGHQTSATQSHDLAVFDKLTGSQKTEATKSVQVHH